MSTTATTPDLDKTPDDTYVAHSPLSALLATLTALVATVLALFDLFANGLWPTCLHLAVGLALDPYFPTDDDPESST